MIFITGSEGVLGKELIKLIDFDYVAGVSRKDCDITDLEHVYSIAPMHPNRDFIIHCAAFTDLVRAEKEKDLCYNTNVIGTRNLASLGIPMLYISTEYVFDGEKGDYSEEDYPNPKNFYAYTKLLGEYESRRTRSVVIRCLFKPRPFKHAFGCVDQLTSGTHANRMAEEIVRAVRIFDHLPPTIHIGFEKKTTFDLARESRPDVKPCKIEDIKGVCLPRDTSLNSSLWRDLWKYHSQKLNLESKKKTQSTEC